MTLPFTWTSIALGGFVSLVILMMVRKNHLAVSYAIWWILVALGSMVIGVFPRLMDWVANGIGVHYPPIFIVALVIALILIKMLTMDVQLSQNERKIRSMAQRIAILDHELHNGRRTGSDQGDP